MTSVAIIHSGEPASNGTNELATEIDLQLRRKDRIDDWLRKAIQVERYTVRLNAQKGKLVLLVDAERDRVAVLYLGDDDDVVTVA